MGTKEQGLSTWAANDPQARGCVIRDGWAYAGSDTIDGYPDTYMRVRTALPDTSSPAFDPAPIAAIFDGSGWGPATTYTQYSTCIDGPGMAWRWWWPLPGWDGRPTDWEQWNDNPSRETRPTYAAPSTGYMKFTECGGDAECIMRAGPAQT